MSVLYLGLDPSHFFTDRPLIHYPVITLVARVVSDPEVQQALAQATHILFTSQHAVRFFFEQFRIGQQILIAIGKATAQALPAPAWVASEETQEGLVELLKGKHLDEAYFLLPRSSRSRPVLTHFFQQAGIRHYAFDLYDTILHQPGPPPDLAAIDEIVFTSPSTVEGFLRIFGPLPKDKKLRAIGPITQAAINSAQLL
jgi:uroporphyrinogen-III synthase